MQKTISNNILFIILMRGITLLLFCHLSIIDLIIGNILGIFLIYLYQKSNLKNNKFWKIILIFIFSIINIHLLITTTYFIKNTLAFHLSFNLIIASLIILTIYISYLNYHSYLKIVELSTYILLFFFIISFLLLIPYIDIKNLITIKLIITTNSLQLAFYYLIIFIAINYLTNSEVKLKSCIYSITNTIIIKLLTILTLSETLIKVFPYPYISMFKRISYFSFIERVEKILAIQFLFDYFFLIVLFTMSVKYLINILKKNRH